MSTTWPAMVAGPAFTRLFAVADSAEAAYITPAAMTRLGITWHSEAEPDDDVETNLKRSTLPQDLVDFINTQSNNLDP